MKCPEIGKINWKFFPYFFQKETPEIFRRFSLSERNKLFHYLLVHAKSVGFFHVDAQSVNFSRVDGIFHDNLFLLSRLFLDPRSIEATAHSEAKHKTEHNK